MNTLLTLLLLGVATLFLLRYGPKRYRLQAARYLRRFANWVSPDNF